MSVGRLSETFGKNSGAYEIDLVKLSKYCLNEAKNSLRKRYLLLIHEGDFETCHRFINALIPGTQLAVHKHPSKLQTEMYIPIEGEAVVVSFTETGVIDKYLFLGKRCKGKIIEIKPNTWHTIIPLTEFVMLEIKGQSENYSSDKDKIFAPWAPKEGDRNFDNYIEKVLSEIDKLSGE